MTGNESNPIASQIREHMAVIGADGARWARSIMSTGIASS